jgi:excisionase family DNA binding protein
MSVAIQGYLTTQEAAEFIGCTDSRIRQMVRAKELRGIVQVGKKTYLIPTSEAERVRENPSKIGRPRATPAA